MLIWQARAAAIVEKRLECVEVCEAAWMRLSSAVPRLLLSAFRCRRVSSNAPFRVRLGGVDFESSFDFLFTSDRGVNLWQRFLLSIRS
jgi:hypothetical protein